MTNQIAERQQAVHEESMEEPRERRRDARCPAHKRGHGANPSRCEQEKQHDAADVSIETQAPERVLNRGQRPADEAYGMPAIGGIAKGEVGKDGDREYQRIAGEERR
jgi:hypothetical protein